MPQTICARTTNLRDANYFPVAQSGSARSGFVISSHPWSAPGVFQNARLTLSAAPGAGKSWTLTLYKNAVATALTVTVSDANTTATDEVHSVAVVEGDRVAWYATSAGGASEVPAYIAVDFEPTDASHSCYANVSRDELVASTSYRGLLAYIQGGSALLVANLVSTDGEFDRLDVTTSAGVDAGCSFTVTIYLSADDGATWVAQDGTGGTPDTRVTLNAGETAGYSTFSLPVVAGNLVASRCQQSGGNVWCRYETSVRFVADNEGESMLIGGGANADVAGRWEDGLALGGWRTPEPTRYAGVTTFIVGKARAWTDAAPGAGKSFVFTGRINGADEAPEATISGTDKSGYDAANGEMEVVGTDYWGFQFVGVGSPSAPTLAVWAAVQNPVYPGGTVIPVFDQYYRRMRGAF